MSSSLYLSIYQPSGPYALPVGHGWEVVAPQKKTPQGNGFIILCQLYFNVFFKFFFKLSRGARHDRPQVNGKPVGLQLQSTCRFVIQSQNPV